MAADVWRRKAVRLALPCLPLPADAGQCDRHRHADAVGVEAWSLLNA